MTFESILEDIRKNKLAGRLYEKEGHQRFRDSVTVCRNGRMKFERYCYGEAASLVCTMWAESADAEGKILWNYDDCPYSGKHEAPEKLTDINNGNLVFDDKRLVWCPKEDMKSVPGSGVSRLSVMFGK